MSTDGKIHVRVTEVTVSVVPEDSIDHSMYAVAVQWRGGESYAVVKHRRCLDAKGDWDYESIPSERTDEWIAAHRFDYDTAYAMAIKVAPEVHMNGRTAAEVVALIAPGQGVPDDPS